MTVGAGSRPQVTCWLAFASTADVNVRVVKFAATTAREEVVNGPCVTRPVQSFGTPPPVSDIIVWRVGIDSASGTCRLGAGRQLQPPSVLAATAPTEPARTMLWLASSSEPGNDHETGSVRGAPGKFKTSFAPSKTSPALIKRYMTAESAM